MRFFLIAPLDRQLDAVADPDSTAAALLDETVASDGSRTRLRQDGTSLRSRLDSRDSEFRQRWTPFALPAMPQGFAGIEVETAWLVEERRRTIALMIVTADPTAAETAIAFEGHLTDFVIANIRAAEQLGDSEPLWVNRTALLAHGESTPAGWVDGSRTTVRLEQLHASGEDVVAELGWGNNSIVGWGGPLEGTPDTVDRTDAARWQVVRGLVDAQVMWCELESLSAHSATVIDEVFNHPQTGRRRSQRLRELLGSAERLSAGIAAHHLAFDDLLLNLQGPRRAVAEGSLDAWRYEDVLSRVARRMRDLNQVLDQRKSALERRYQGLVEGVLAALSLITLLDLVLSFVIVSHEGTEDISGEGSPLHFFDFIRATNTDVLVLVSFLVIAAVGVVVLALRRRA